MRHTAVFVRAGSSRRNPAKAQRSKEVTGVTVCKSGFFAQGPREVAEI